MEEKNTEFEENVVNTPSKKKSTSTGRKRKKPKAEVANASNTVAESVVVAEEVVQNNIEEEKKTFKEEFKSTENETTKVEEFKEEKTKKECSNSALDFIKRKKGTILKILIPLIIVGVVLFIIFNRKTDEISKVNRILKEDFYTIDCLDNSCEQVAAYSGNPTKDTTVTLIKNGDTVAKYSYTYNAEDKISKSPIALGNNWFVFKKLDTETKKVTGYSIANKKGKEEYSTELELSVLNDNLALMKDSTKGINAYTILNPSGKVLFKNVNDVDVFNDKKIISIEENSTKKILDAEGNIVLNNYYVSNAIYDEDGKIEFILVKDSKNNAYYYFDINKLKIVGDNFQNYKDNGDGTLTITKKQNNKVVKFTLYKDGKQEEIGEDVTQSQIVSDLKKDIDENTYSLYATSVYDKDQKYVFVDNLQDKSFGIYEISNKEYTKLYSYKADSSNTYSSIYTINNSNKLNYYQVSCSTYSCDKSVFYVYDLENNKEIFKLDTDDSSIVNYYQYEDGYKVVKYSYSSNDDKYRGKYVLLDGDNKELAVATNRITVVDKKQLIGAEATTSLVVYSAKDNKVLNSDDSLASRITVNNNKYYKFTADDKTKLVDTKGKEVLNIDSKFDIIYSSKVLVYIDGNTVNIFNGGNGKTKQYELKENEKLNDGSGNLIPPYRGALFINNSADKVFKVVNSTGKVIKTIKDAEIDKLYYTKEGKVVIISKALNGSDTLYGLYIAE